MANEYMALFSVIINTVTVGAINGNTTDFSKAHGARCKFYSKQN